jgi:hypothetical protein
MGAMTAIATPQGLAEDTLGDARWFPLRFNPQSEEFHFAFIPAQRHRELVFLKSVPAGGSETRILPLSAIRDVAPDSSALHLILHSGLGGSTLLAQALAQPGVAVALQEPPILTDVIAYGLTHSAATTHALLEDVTRLLSRPLSAGEATVCKMNSVSNRLGVAMAAVHGGSQILCLDTTLEEMLTSFASRGTEGRMAGRKLLIGIRNAGMTAIEMSEKELAELTDLQMVALSWLAMRKTMIETAANFGAGRVGSITSAQLMTDTGATLGAVAMHLRLGLDVESRLASGVFDRHSKTGEPFNPQQRAERVAETLRVHAQEIEPVVTWARKVAEATGIASDLPYPLLG